MMDGDYCQYERHHVNDKAPTEGAHGLASLERSPNYHTDHPREGVARQQAEWAHQEALTMDRKLRK